MKDAHPIFRLRDSLKEALCLRHLFEFAMELPTHQRDIEYDEVTKQVVWSVREVLSRKEFRIKAPGLFPDLSPAEFIGEWDFAVDVWFDATEAQRKNVFAGSFANRNATQIMEAMRAKGLKPRWRMRVVS